MEIMTKTSQKSSSSSAKVENEKFAHDKIRRQLLAQSECNLAGSTLQKNSHEPLFKISTSIN